MHKLLFLLGIPLIALGFQSCTSNAALEQRIVELENKIRKYDEIITFETDGSPTILLKDINGISEVKIFPHLIMFSNSKGGSMFISVEDISAMSPTFHTYFSMGLDENKKAQLILNGDSSSCIELGFRSGGPSLNIFSNNKSMGDFGQINDTLHGLRIFNKGNKAAVIISTVDNDGFIALADRYGDIGWYQDGKK